MAVTDCSVDVAETGTGGVHATTVSRAPQHDIDVVERDRLHVASYKLVFADSEDDEAAAGIPSRVPVLAGEILRPPNDEELFMDGSASSRPPQLSDSDDFVEDVEPRPSGPARLQFEKVPVVRDLRIPGNRDAKIFYRTSRLAKRARELDSRETSPEPSSSLVKQQTPESTCETLTLLKNGGEMHDPTVDVHLSIEGYRLTLDERDLVDDWSCGLSRPIPQRHHVSAIKEKGAPEDEDAQTNGEDESDPLTSTIAAQEEEEEEDGVSDEDDELDDLIEVAAVEKLLECSRHALSEGVASERDLECYRGFIAAATAELERLSRDDDISIFSLNMQPWVGKLYGVMRRSQRPPPSAPIIINGVVMDM